MDTNKCLYSICKHSLFDEVSTASMQAEYSMILLVTVGHKVVGHT